MIKVCCRNEHFFEQPNNHQTKFEILVGNTEPEVDLAETKIKTEKVVNTVHFVV